MHVNVRVQLRGRHRRRVGEAAHLRSVTVRATPLKLTTYFGERDRSGAGFLRGTRFVDVYARASDSQTSAVMRGVEGFGAKHRLRGERLADAVRGSAARLPSLSITRGPIEAALGEVSSLRFDGLITLERAKLLTTGEALRDSPRRQPETKLTVYTAGTSGQTAGRSGSRSSRCFTGEAWAVRQAAAQDEGRRFERRPSARELLRAQRRGAARSCRPG